MVKVDAVIQLIPVTKFPIMFFANLVTLLFSGMMIYYGWRLVMMQAATNQYTIIMEIPLELLYAVLPIMGIMMFIRTIMVMHQDWQAWQKARAAKPA